MHRERPRQSQPEPADRGRGRVVALPLSRLDEAALLAQLQEGRPAAFRELFDRYHGLIRGLMVRMVGVDGDVEDLIQETLIVVVRRCPTLRDPSALRSFVYSIALRTARNELRKRALRRFLPWSDDLPVPAATAPKDPVLFEAVQRLHRVLDQLSPDLRIAFVLRFVEGYELTEAAAAAGTSLATFKRRLSRATARFELLAGRDPVLVKWLEEGSAP